jgi:DUF1680 family protein
MPKITRRWFFGSAVAAATAGVASPQQRGAPIPRPADPLFEPRAFALRVRPFPLTRVRLLDGPCRDVQEINRKLLRELPNDRLLRNFYSNAGLPASAEPLGGWEIPWNGQPDHRASELRGHFVGHYLSACALMYASAGDASLKQKADELVTELAKCQEKLGGGYLSAFPTANMDRLKTRTRVWAPFYTYHKILAGMLDMHTLAGNQQALAVAEGMARWTADFLKDVNDDQMQEILRVEWGGMNEALYNLYAITGKVEYARTGDRFYKKSFLEPLRLHRDELTGLHVNTHVPQVIGMARRYELASYDRDRDISEFFYDAVVNGRGYATGGTSNNESWRLEPGRLAAEMSVASQECCVSYNMMKLARHLFTWSADPRYADYYERHIYNTRLGTQHPAEGALMYYLPIVSGYWKTFGTRFGAFWCCTGTGVEEFAKLGDSIYFHNDGELFVNLFISSELDWPEKGVKVRQETKFPEQEGATLLIQVSQPVEFALNIRIPYWAARGGSVKINGSAIPAFGNPSSYLKMRRTWKSGDRVELSLPMGLHVAGLPDDPSLQAVMYGPMVLAGMLGKVPSDRIFGPNAPRRGGAQPAKVPSFEAASRDPNTWIKPVGGKPLTFRTTGQAQDMTLVPLHRIFDEYYAVYWKVNSGMPGSSV